MTTTERPAPRYANWRDEYASRQKSIGEAMALIQEGDLVAVPILAPAVLTAALLDRATQLGRVDLRFLAPREAPLFAPDGPKGEKEIEIFIGDGLRPRSRPTSRTRSCWG